MLMAMHVPSFPATMPLLVGTVGLAFEPGIAASAELGIVVSRSCWGRGFGTTAARIVVRVRESRPRRRST